MHVKQTDSTPTNATLYITLDDTDLTPIKQNAVQQLGLQLKLPGFRPGRAPAALLEKNIESAALQNEVLEQAINHFYEQAIRSQKLRPVAQPQVSVKKFVPFTTLEVEVTVDVIGKITLPDYTKLSVPRPTVNVPAADVNEVLENLRQRTAAPTDVDRAAKKGDQTVIAFKGVDKDGQAIAGAEGKDYPLVLGSNSFIPGFEDELIGLKAGDQKTFDITFPKDYGAKELANAKVTFTVTVDRVQELKLPALDDAFAAQSGPFKTLKELKADIKKQLTTEKEQAANRNYENEVLDAVTAKSKVAIPESLIEEQLEVAEREERQNLMYRGQTWDEHLKAEGVTEKEHRDRNRASAEARVKAGLVLSEIADREKVQVTPEELEVRLEVLRGQYKDAAMQAELDKPENRRDIAMRILSEKTMAKLLSYVSKKTNKTE